MARTDEDAVIAILGGDYDASDNIEVEQFIDIAAEMVDDYCGSADYADAKLEKIERYLAAHLYAVTARRTVTEQIGGGAGGASGTVRVTYESKVDFGLDLTPYGQMAKRLDPKGLLAAADNAMNDIKSGLLKPSITYLGQNETTE